MNNDTTNNYIVCTIIKNEEPYIREFVEYHLQLGFDKIVIADNNDFPNQYEPILQDLIDNNKVEIISRVGIKGQQREFYDLIIDNYPYQWCAFIDCDEFITFNPDNKFNNNIKEFLNSNPDIKAYKLNWMVYGDSNHITKPIGKVTENFTIPQPIDFNYTYDFPENAHTKSIIHKDFKGHFTKHPHSVDNNNYYTPSGKKSDASAFNKNMEYDIIYIRHFYTKSLEEWMKYKYHKGHADAPKLDRDKTYQIDWFFKYNQKTPEKIKWLIDNGYVIK